MFVGGIGFKTFWYQKSIGIGFEKNWYRKKYWYRKKIGIKKYRIRYRKKISIGKMFRIRFHSDFGFRHTLIMIVGTLMYSKY